MRAFDQHFDRAVGQLQHLQDRGHAADRIEILGARIVLGGGLLRDEQDVLAGVHRHVERLDGLGPPDEQRNAPCAETRRRPAAATSGSKVTSEEGGEISGHAKPRRGVPDAKWGR